MRSTNTCLRLRQQRRVANAVARVAHHQRTPAETGFLNGRPWALCTRSTALWTQRRSCARSAASLPAGDSTHLCGDARATPLPDTASSAASALGLRLEEQLQDLIVQQQQQQRQRRSKLQRSCDEDSPAVEAGSETARRSGDDAASVDQSPTEGAAEARGEEAVMPAWQRGLQLVPAAGASSAALEWLLLLCLDSQATPSAAPLEVVEGVYAAWRRQSAQERASVAAGAAAPPTAEEVDVESRPPSRRRAYTSKGVHHHYAAHLLRTHHAVVAAVETAAEERTEPATSSALQHRAAYLLSGVLEVLLVHLPQDAAHDPRLTSAQATLRPTSALLVLEAVRHAARSHGRPPKGVLDALDSSADLDLLSRLLTTAADASLEESALAAVARACFEVVMRGTAAGAAHMSASAALRQRRLHSMQNDALVLYSAFLATVHAPPSASGELASRQVRNVEEFVVRGSHTTRWIQQHSRRQRTQQQQRQQQERPEDADHIQDGPGVSPSSAPAQAVAAGLRRLLCTYLTAPTHSEGVAEAVQPHQQRTRDSVIGALCQRHALRAPHARDTSPPWCAWMLRVLLHEESHRDAQQRQTAAAAAEGRAPGPSEAVAPHEVNAGEAPMFALATQLVLELRRHSQATVARYISSTRATVSQERIYTRARWPLQQVWVAVMEAALQGQLVSAGGDDGDGGGRRRLEGHAATPAVLLRLCYPHYDKTQWRRPSVNLYLQLLDQWGESAQVRHVFTVIAGRERHLQTEVQRAVVAKRLESGGTAGAAEGDDSSAPAVADDGGASSGESAERRRGSAGAAALALRRYRPALSLSSCLVVLRHCGCPRRVLAAVSEGQASDSANDGDVDEVAALTSTRVLVQQAAVARDVLRYIICALHVAQHRLARVASQRDDGEDDDSNTDGVDPASALMVEGVPVEGWVAWLRGSCVPALAQLHHAAGQDERWAELGYGEPQG
ncbi:hypothetical protein NESM_000356800 [Novymonas esmeraldas]|uniref:Uncharacterized protein n=1 Tax=Novymonas esmeraldas TaxID=1808958 RepID=A0AAW0EL64_9TRYP